MAVWSKASQWHEMFCYDPEVMGVNRGQIEFDVCSLSVLAGPKVFYE